MRRLASRALGTLVIGVLLAAGPPDPGELLVGVGQVASLGLPGPVHPLSNDWWPIAGGDDDATFPSLFVAARQYGAGRVVIVGHGGVITNTAVLDNAAFNLNATSWLDGAGTGEVRFTTGHGEWLGGSALADFQTLVEGAGMTLAPLAAPIDAATLNGVSVLIAGNAWGEFSAAEIDVVRQWVEAGGGLLMAGLGWSWAPYHPGTTIDDYPMMKLAVPYEVRWLQNTISDPTNQEQGSAVFHTLYPDIQVATVNDAISVIESIHAAQGGNLPDSLEADADLRLSFVRAHQTLAIPAAEFPPAHAARTQVFDAYEVLVTDEATFYARNFSFDDSNHPTSAWVRERMWRTWRDALDLTPQRKSQMLSLGQLSGGQRDVFDDFGVILLDNVALDSRQTGVVHDYLSLIPSELYRLRAISVHGLLGDPPIDIPLAGPQWAVNIFGFPVGTYIENAFPSDIEPGLVDVFSGATAHEINHVVDAFFIRGSAELAARRDMLIADAGEDPLNYLRSMFPAGTFVNAPQEFFASISNQWFQDSEKTIQLGLLRFDNGRGDPINQALFFADIYSRGGDTTYFYTTDTAGNIDRMSINLRRDDSGRVDSIRIGDIRYEFDLDGDGRVTAYATALAADFDGDGEVAMLDLFRLFSDWGPCPNAPDTCWSDLDGDGQVGLADLFIVFAGWT